MSELNPRTRLWLLALGAVAGLLAAASGLVERWRPEPGSLPEDVVARVGERLIPMARYRELLSDLEADKRAALTDADRRFVVDRLIDEELLIVRGMELGLAETSPEIRKAIAASVIAHLAAEAGARPPDEAALRRIYAEDPEFFTSPARFRAQWWVRPVSGAGDAGRVAEAVGSLGDEPSPERVLLATGFTRETALPDALLPMAKLADYLGQELARRLGAMAPGEFTGPAEAGGVIHVLHLIERQAARLAPFEESRQVLEAEQRRRAGDRALREYLDWLRERTPVVIDPGAVAEPGGRD